MNPFQAAGLPMPKGTRVSWSTGNGFGLGGVHFPPTPGHGVTIADEDNGTVLVAVHSQGEMHHVIHCNVTWLTVEDAAPP